jgi:hypothetical protein
MRIAIEISSITPMLMHRFNEEEAYTATSFKDKNLKPIDIATKFLYKDDKGLYFPTSNILAAIMIAGKFHKLGKNKITTMKSSLIPAGLSMEGERAYFGESQEWVVDSRSVVVPSTGARVMSHRPRLDKWKLGFTLIVDNKLFSSDLVRILVDDAGTKAGIGDFRPARKGIYGKFVVTKWETE